MPFVRPVVKLAATAGATPEIPGLVDEAFAVARRPHTGPVFLDFPLDVVFMEADADGGAPRSRRRARGAAPTATRSTARVALLGDAERPVIMAGTNLYWGRGEDGAARRSPRRAASRSSSTASRAAACPPTTSSRSRARARRRSRRPTSRSSIGVPMDFRLGFGGAFGEETEIVVIDVAEPRARAPAQGRRRALRRPARRRSRAARPARGHDTQRVGRAPARDRDREARDRARAARRRRARRCTRCASTASSPRCSTATRS